MSCKLCFETNDDYIDVTSDEGVELNVRKILNKHLPFCCTSNSKDGVVCRKCWCKVELFHEFYVYIESIHCSIFERENVYVSSINDNLLEPFGNGDAFNRLDADIKSFENEIAGYSDIIEQQNGFSNIETAKKRKSIKSNQPSKIPNEMKIAKDNPSDQIAFTMLATQKRSNSDKIFKCDSCSLLFLSRSKLYAHIKNEHLALRFKCPTPRCYDSFSTQTQLDDHVNKIHEKSDCPLCKKSLLKHRLALHIQNYHNENSRIVCDLCGKMLNSSSYSEHIQNVHETEEKLQCDICKAWLLNKSTLRIHINRRHVQTSQQCPICKKISPNKNALRNHVKTHSNEARQKFKCSICGKGCRDNYNLTDHMRVHSDVKSYVCTFCDTAYRTGKSLRKHMKRDHSDLE